MPVFIVEVCKLEEVCAMRNGMACHPPHHRRLQSIRLSALIQNIHESLSHSIVNSTDLVTGAAVVIVFVLTTRFGLVGQIFYGLGLPDIVVIL